MAQIRIELKNKNDEKVVYTQNKVTARSFRRGLEVTAALEEQGGSPVKAIDDMIDFVVELFDNPKVTEDTILDGLDSDELMPAIQSIIQAVMGTGNATEGKK